MDTVAISGVTGQTGSYLAELFLEKGYKVYGMKRRSSSLNTERIDHLFDNPNLKLVYGDVTDFSSVSGFISDIQPDIFINCAAQSHVKVSFDLPIYTLEATGNSVLNCLESIKKYSKHTKFVTMSSSEMFGSTPPPQNELSTMSPCSVYAIAKLTGYNLVKHYRDTYGLFASNAICFNHESPRRGCTFVTKKISRSVSRIFYNLDTELRLGNLSALRDWGHASDTADAVYRIAMAESPDEFVVATGEIHSVQEFVEIAFNKVNLDWKKYVVIDKKYFREKEVDALMGDSKKIREKLGWSPKYNFNMLVDEMLEYDLNQAKKELLIKNNIK
jgi:GDPmannose 4,6-dehydratase